MSLQETLQDKPLKILHISDLHFGFMPDHKGYSKLLSDFNLKKIFDPQSLIRQLENQSLQIFNSHDSVVINYLLKYIENSDIKYIVITGDVATSESEQDLKLAKNFLNDLSAMNKTIVVIPGNHDKFTAQSFYSKKNNNNFYKILTKTKNINILCSNFYNYVITENNKTIKLIYFDFTLPSNNSYNNKILKMSWKKYFGRGRVGDIDVIVNKNDNEEIIACCHFSLREPLARQNLKPIKHLILEEEQKFLQFINQNNIKIIMSGHFHKCSFLNYKDINFLSAGSASAYGTKFKNIIHEVNFYYNKIEIKNIEYNNDFHSLGFEFKNSITLPCNLFT
jgi:DNA repair exonuclease SbcCD nuclease subunit